MRKVCRYFRNFCIQCQGFQWFHGSCGLTITTTTTTIIIIITF